MKINSQIFQDSNNTYFPKTEEEVSILIKEFYKKNLPTEIVGTNTKSFIGNKTQASNKISLSKLSGIIDYFPEELYIKVKAGTPLEDVEKALEKNNQELAFEPIDLGFIENGKTNKGTVAGCLSCNYAGSRRFKVGSVRDHVLGFKELMVKEKLLNLGEQL
jgi:glycolate oxidase FAD binding subunit